MSTLSRRTLVTAAGALPALAVPALASPAVAASPSACTLPPDLVERFVRLRAWYLEFSDRCDREHGEVNKRFYAATGLTFEQWSEMDHSYCRAGDFDNPRRKELQAVRNRLSADFSTERDDDPECDELCDERWAVAEALMQCKSQTVADLAWQLEAYLIADLELTGPRAVVPNGLLGRFFRQIRALGGVPQPDDPGGRLSIDDRDDDAA